MADIISLLRSTKEMTGMGNTLKQINKCVEDYEKGCSKHAHFIRFHKGTYLFTGIKNEANTINSDIYSKIIGQLGAKKGNSHALETKQIMFAQPTLDETNISYGTTALNKTGGAILISQLNSELNVAGVSDPDCIPFFNSREDYASSEAQCFCDQNLGGYVNASLTLHKTRISLTDISVCDISKIATPIGYIPRQRYGELSRALKNPAQIKALITPIAGAFSANAYYEQILAIEKFRADVSVIN